MMDLKVVKTAENMKIESAVLLFSCGKDSVVSYDIIRCYTNIKIIPVLLYFIKDLSIRNNVIKFYEKRYKEKVLFYPHPDLSKMMNKKKLYMRDTISYIRKELNQSWIIEGIKKNDSLHRRGILAHIENGIDDRNKKIYPIMNWSDKDITAYIKKEKLMIPIDYSYGFKHEHNTPSAEMLLWLKNNFVSDYMKALKQFPQLETLVWKKENGC